MGRAQRLNPLDLVVTIRLLRPARGLAELATELDVSVSQVHAAIKRAQFAGLLRPGTRDANRHALAEFLEHGVRYAFPCRPGADADGVPTAHSAQPLADDIVSPDAYVWPAPKAAGRVRGAAITPLYGNAARLLETSPDTYRLLTLVDALRVGRARERKLALQYLHSELGRDAA